MEEAKKRIKKHRQNKDIYMTLSTKLQFSTIMLMFLAASMALKKVF